MDQHTEQIIVAIFSLIFVTIISASVMTMFRVNSGYILTGGTVLQNFSELDLSIAGCARSCLNECSCAIYSRAMRQCVTFSDKIYETTVTWMRDPLWSVIFQHKEILSVQHGNWTLVFRGQRDINQAVSDRWLSNNVHDDNPVLASLPVHCYRLDMFISCPTHFRSYILDNWTNIDKVKFSLYTDGAEVKSIIFNGTGTTSINWFQKDRVSSSSWSALTNDLNGSDFAFQSRHGLPLKRRFVINRYATCLGDTSYLETFDTNYEFCNITYNLSLLTYPKFLYSPFHTSVRLSAVPTVYKFADIIAVFVQFIAP